MMKLDGSDLLVAERCDRKYFLTDFFRGLNTGGAEARVVFWYVGGGSKIKSAVTVCSLDRSEIQSGGAGLQRWLGFAFGLERTCRSGVQRPLCGIPICWTHFCCSW